MPNLREAYKEIYQSQVNEAHYNPATGKIQAEKPTREEIVKLAREAAASGPKKRQPVGSVRKNSPTFKPSSPKKAKADMESWSSYWGGPKNEEKDPSYLEPDMKKRLKNNEKAIEDMENTRANKDMVAAVRKKFDEAVADKKGNTPAYQNFKKGDNRYRAANHMDEATAMAKRGYDEAGIRNTIADKTIKANTKAGRTVDKATALEDKPTYGDDEKKEGRGKHARAQRGTFHSTNSSNPGLHGNPYNANKKPSESDPNTPERVGELQGARGKQRARVGLTPNERKLYTSYEYDRFDTILEYLISEGYADTNENALAIMANMSNAWLETIEEEWKPVENLDEKARGTRKKTNIHAYDADETLFGHGKKGKPTVQVHVNDSSGKRVQSLSNQDFNTHKLDKDKGHSYDFSEFQSAKKFGETSSPNKKVIKDLRRKQARGQNVHIITARSKFDNPSEFQGHLQKHGIDIPKNKIHYTGGMKGSDVGTKKVDTAKGIAKQSGAKNISMYDDAPKVNNAFEKEKQNNSTFKKIKTYLAKPNASGETTLRSYQATK